MVWRREGATPLKNTQMHASPVPRDMELGSMSKERLFNKTSSSSSKTTNNRKSNEFGIWEIRQRQTATTVAGSFSPLISRGGALRRSRPLLPLHRHHRREDFFHFFLSLSLQNQNHRQSAIKALKNRFQSSSPFEKLPHELVLQILYRKTREKPSFALYFGGLRWPDTLDHITYDNESTTWSESCSKLSLTFLPSTPRKIEFWGSSNGLVLCSGADYLGGPRVYHVCNPLTRQCVHLPRGPSPQCGHEFFYVGIVCTTDYSVATTTTTRFKVVRLVAPEVPHFSHWTEASGTLSLDIFDSQISQWSSYPKVLCPHAVSLKVQDPIVVENNRILHWSGSSGLCMVGVDILIAYDPYNDPGKCRFIKLLGDHIEPLVDTIRIYATQGQLLFWHYLNNNLWDRPVYLANEDIPNCNIWRLKDYESGGMVLEHSVVINEGVLGDRLYFRQTRSGIGCILFREN